MYYTCLGGEQELTVDVFVPNDTFLSEEKSIGLITGSNGSGKSVYLKQVSVSLCVWCS